MTGATGKKILLVDYEVSKMKATEDFLTQAGFDVVKAFDGLDALEKFSEEQPDLVLLSAMLPKLHGFEVCKAIKHSDTGRKIPVLITTSVYKSYKYKRQAMKDYLADDYILKPFNYEELLAKIREHLGLGELTEGPMEDTAEDHVPKAVASEETDGEFDSLLDQTLETLLSKPKEKGKVQSHPKPDKKVTETSDLDEILETTLSGLLNEIGDRRQHPKSPVVKKKPRPEESTVEMKTVEAPVPPSLDVAKMEAEGEATTIPTDYDIDGLTATEEESQEVPEIVVPAEKPPVVVEEVPEPAKKELVIEEVQVPEKEESRPEPVAEEPPDQAEPPDQLDKIIDEAIAIFEEEISEEKKSAAAEVPVQVGVSGEPPVQYTEPVPGAEVKLDSESRFGKYKLIEKIAVGGMAEMWKAKQIGPEGFEKVVALKRILPNLAENDDFITMFIDEGKVAAQLTHPNIAQIYELGETMGGYYLAMEYIAGKDLRLIMRLARKEKKNLAIPQAVVIAGKLLSGLNYAHRKKGFNNENLNIVHRDVSPQNVLISYEGEVKLVDFGIAKAAAKNSVTLTGALKGKILYMSPEQAWGQIVDRRSDVFSVGTLLYEMLTGKRVFIADNEMAILQKVREWNPPPPSAVNARISSRLDAIVLKAIEKDPDKRYQTAEEMRHDLEAYLHLDKPPKSLMDLGLFMRALFKDEIKAEMPELLESIDESVLAIDPFTMEQAFSKPKAPEPDTEKAVVVETSPEKATPEPAPPEPVPVDSKSVEAEPAETPEEEPVAAEEPVEAPAEAITAEEEISQELVPSAVTQRDKRKKGGRKDRSKRPAPVSEKEAQAEKPAEKPMEKPAEKLAEKPIEKPAEKLPEKLPEKPIEKPAEKLPEKPPVIEPARMTRDEVIFDEDFLKPSKAASTDRKKMLFIIGGGGAVIVVIILILLLAGGGKKKVVTPIATPTPTVDVQAIANANSTATAIAMATETPTPSPTETVTPRPATRVTREEVIEKTATPTLTPAPTDTPIPTHTPTPTVTQTPTQTPVQLGAYIQYPDVKPEVLTKVTPEMPRAARQMGVEGNITLKVLVSETGEVLDIETLRASDQLEKSGCVKAAQDAVKKWVFQPATHKGVPVKTHVNLVLPFRRK
ncbi:TonB family protein [bacterium]|nr:TonB family protein [candidate division CSSED10-310 bacterium]